MLIAERVATGTRMERGTLLPLGPEAGGNEVSCCDAVVSFSDKNSSGVFPDSDDEFLLLTGLYHTMMKMSNLEEN